MSTEKATEITNRLENLTWEEGLRELGLCNPEKAQGKPCQGVWIPDGTTKMEPDSSQQCPTEVQQAMDTKWNTENFLSTKDYFLSVSKQQPNTGIGLWREAGVSCWGMLENSGAVTMVLSNLLQLTLLGGQATGLEVPSNLSYSVDSEQKQCEFHIISVSPTCFFVTIQQLHFHEKLGFY